MPIPLLLATLQPSRPCYDPATYISSLTLQDFSSLSPLAPLGIKGCVSYLVAKLFIIISRYLSITNSCSVLAFSFF